MKNERHSRFTVKVLSGAAALLLALLLMFSAVAVDIPNAFATGMKPADKTQLADPAESPQPEAEPEPEESSEPAESAEPTEAPQPEEETDKGSRWVEKHHPSGKKVKINLEDEIFTKKESLTEPEKKLSNALLQLSDSKHLLKGTTRSQLIDRMKQQRQIKQGAAANGASGGSSGLSAYVYIQLEQGYDFDMLSRFVPRIENKDEENGLAAAWVDVSMIKGLSSLKGVTGVREVLPPIVYAGAKMTQGDSILKADLVKSEVGVDGTGVKIGIISDGVDHMASAVTSGDLPAGVTVLNNRIGGDEGTAMLEIVHDLAPGAELYFHDCGADRLAFNAAITALADAGCDIICDDIGWLAEPFFEDGVIAKHVANIIASRGIVYVTAAGNSAQDHYQGNFYNSSKWHDFSRGTDPYYTDLYMDIEPGDEVVIILQWNDKFGASGNDYDLWLLDMDPDADDLILGGSTVTQNGNDDPLEGIVYENNTSSTIEAMICVYAYEAPTAKTLELYTYGGSMYSNNIVMADSIFGHPAVPGVISCGTVGANIPGMSGNPDNIRSYSSRGPVTMLSGVRQKPDICGVDGVSITGAGGFGHLNNGNYYFYGTSAAAPHVAAISALLMSKYPLKSPSDIKKLILDNSVDLGPSGYDTIYGYGRADALAAVMSEIQISAVSAGANSAAVSWSAIPGATGYELYRSTSSTSGYTSAYLGSETSFTDAGLVTGITYYYKVRAYYTGGSGTTYGSFSAYASVKPILPIPGSVLAQSASYNSVRVSWNAVDGAAGYRVYRATSAGGKYSLVATTASLSCTNTKLNTGTTYYYKVCAYVGAAKTNGGYSAVVSAKPMLSKVTGQNAVMASATSVRISWSAVAGRTSYQVLRSDAPDGVYKVIGTTTKTYYTNSKITPNRTYYYKVRAYRTVQRKKIYSPESDVTSAMPVFQTVSGASASMYSVTGNKITWNAVPGRKGYEIWRSDAEDGVYKYIATTTSTYYYNKSLIPNRTYYYKVRAYVMVGKTKYRSGFSNVTSAMPVFQTVSGASATMYTVSSNRITWNAVPGRKGYEIWRSDAEDGVYKYITTTTNTYYYNKSLIPNRTYYYKVRAYVMVGKTKYRSGFSNITSAMPMFQSVTGVAGTVSSPTSSRLTWNAVPGRSGYAILRSATADGTYKVIGTTTKTYYTDTKCLPNRTYYYKVRAYVTVSRVKRYSDASDSVSVTPIVNAVTGAAHTMSMATKVKLTWSAVTGRTKYEILRSDAQDGPYTLIGSTTYTYFYNSGLVPGQTYYYKIRAYKLISKVKYYGGDSDVVTAIAPMP